jgi:hypothetical protein
VLRHTWPLIMLLKQDFLATSVILIRWKQHDLDLKMMTRSGLLLALMRTVATSSPNMDVDLEDGNLVTFFTSNGLAVVPPTLQKCLGDHIVFLWEKCNSQLISNFAVLFG